MSLGLNDIVFTQPPSLFLVGTMASSFLLGMAVASAPYMVRAVLTVSMEAAARVAVRVVSYSASALISVVSMSRGGGADTDDIDTESGDNPLDDPSGLSEATGCIRNYCAYSDPGYGPFIDLERGVPLREWLYEGRPCVGVGFFPIYPVDEIQNRTGVLFSTTNLPSETPPISISPVPCRMTHRTPTPSLEIQSVVSDISDVSASYAYSEPIQSKPDFVRGSDPILFDPELCTQFRLRPASAPATAQSILMDHIHTPPNTPILSLHGLPDLIEEEVTLDMSEDDDSPPVSPEDEEDDSQSVWSVVSSSAALDTSDGSSGSP